MKALLDSPLTLTEEAVQDKLNFSNHLRNKEELVEKRFVVFFHDDADGWGSAGIALNGLTDPDRKFVMRPVNYTDNFSDILDHLEEDDHVYVLDFSFKRDICDAINDKVEKLVILDHHKTAQEELKDAPYAIFDMTKSGVLLTYEYFFKEFLSGDYESVPIPVRLLDNYDLWKKEDPYVGWNWVVGFHLYVKDYFGDYEFWRELMAMSDLTPDIFAILKQKYEDFKTTIEELMSSAEFTKHTFTKEEYNTPRDIVGVFYPASDHISLLADAVRSSELKPDFTASYHINEAKNGSRKLIVSLRGTEGFHVDTLAKVNGGGGHALAAGYSFPFTSEDIIVIDRVIEQIHVSFITSKLIKERSAAGIQNLTEDVKVDKGL